MPSPGRGTSSSSRPSSEYSRIRDRVSTRSTSASLLGGQAGAPQHAVSLRDELVPGRALARALERYRHEAPPRSAVGGDREVAIAVDEPGKRAREPEQERSPFAALDGPDRVRARLDLARDGHHPAPVGRDLREDELLVLPDRGRFRQRRPRRRRAGGGRCASAAARCRGRARRCRRTRSSRGARRRRRTTCARCGPGRRRPDSTSRTWRTLCSSPRCDSPKATWAPSGAGENQSSDTSVPGKVLGSTIVRPPSPIVEPTARTGPLPGPPATRRNQRCPCCEGTKTSDSCRRRAAASRRASSAGRAPIVSRAAASWRCCQLRVSGESSSSQR